MANYTTAEAAPLLGLTRHSVNTRIDKGLLTAKKLGGRWYITSDEIDRYNRERRPTGWHVDHPNMTREEWFWSLVDKNGPVPEACPELGPCWIWLGSRLVDGYGSFSIGTFQNPKNVRAHRYSYELKHGPIEDGKHILHKCDTPLCVNNETHLRPGTAAENSNDALVRGRLRHGSGKQKLSSSDIADIRERYSAGGITQATLAAEYQLTKNYVSQIIRRKARPH